MTDPQSDGRVMKSGTQTLDPLDGSFPYGVEVANADSLRE
jgi:hypothetical protein